MDKKGDLSIEVIKIENLKQDLFKLQNEAIISQKKQKNIHLMKTNANLMEPQFLQIQKRDNEYKSFDYSMKSSKSLHSHFSFQPSEQFHSIQQQSVSCSQAQDVKITINSESMENQQHISSANTLEDDKQMKIQRNFSKYKENADLLQPEMFNKILNELTNEKENQLTNPEVQRKTYTSYLHQVVDKNHLQSPRRHKSKQKSSSEKQSTSSPGSNEKSSTKNENQFNVEKDSPKISQQSEYSMKDNSNHSSNKRENSNQQLFIKPIKIQDTRKSQEKSSQSPNSSPHTKRKAYRVSPRKIPQTLTESYDELHLTVTKIQKQKDHMKIPLKLKQKSSQENKSSKQAKDKQNSKNRQKFPEQSPQKQKTKSSSSVTTSKKDEQLLVSLPIIEGFCILRLQNSSQIQTKYIIYKNLVVFQSFKRITIKNISKIKFIEKEESLLAIKICYQLENNEKQQNIIVEVIPETSDTYFTQSYGLFSQIVLRKLLLMNLVINELNEKTQAASFSKSPSNSPVSSPMSLPNTLVKMPPDFVLEGQKLPTQFNAQLYKKSTFFNSWQKKYFVLCEKGLKSYSSPLEKGQMRKTQQQLHKTPQIWTRFELINGYLIVKMWQNKLQKIQIGIPLCDFTDSEGSKNWLYGLSKFLVWKQNQSQTKWPIQKI